jgi:AcrR family transcriptional regulator
MPGMSGGEGVVTTRDRLLNAGAELFRRDGYASTGVKQVATQAGAKLGSLYHFFPGGKEQLGEEVIAWAGQASLEILEGFFAREPDAATAIDAFLSATAESQRASGFADPCPITTIALEVAGTSERLRLAAARVFEEWASALQRHLARSGIDPRTARELALSMVVGVEGAFVVSRATRSVQPVEVVRASLVAAIRAAQEQADEPPAHGKALSS